MVQAVGHSPAFEKTVENINDLQELILQSVSSQLDTLLPYVDGTFKETALNKTITTDYKDVGYPSKNKGNQEGMTKDGDIDMSSLKKPITEPSKVELASMVHKYQSNFNSELKYQPLDPSKNSTEFFPESKLNYFDYIALIDSIKNNTSYSESSKEKKLTAVENDLINSIYYLYGEDRKGLTTSLQAWDQVKRVSIPYNFRRFSYLQLLAAYKKDDAINATLKYYSTSIDTLDTIRRYSAAIRQGEDVSLNKEILVNNLNSSYAEVEKHLIKPVEDVLTRQAQEKAAEQAGREEQRNQLNNQLNGREPETNEEDE